MKLHFFNYSILALLLISVIFDFRTRKIPNLLNLVILIAAILISALQTPSLSLADVGLSLGLSFALGTLFFGFGILGGGDIKLLFALAPLFTWSANIELYMYSFLYGSILGLANALLKNETKLVLFKVFLLIKNRKNADIKASPIPFSVAILFGYLSLVLAQLKGISLL